MQIYAQAFIEFMDKNDIKYTEQKENVLKIVYDGENMDSIPVFAIFDDEGDPVVQFKCWNILNFKNNKEKGIEICNSLNCEYRWLRFYVDDDCDVVVSVDAVLGEDSYLDDACGEMCMFYLKRVISILDEAYPQIAKARWA